MDGEIDRQDVLTKPTIVIAADKKAATPISLSDVRSGLFKLCEMIALKGYERGDKLNGRSEIVIHISECHNIRFDDEYFSDFSAIRELREIVQYKKYKTGKTAPTNVLEESRETLRQFYRLYLGDFVTFKFNNSVVEDFEFKIQVSWYSPEYITIDSISENFIDIDIMHRNFVSSRLRPTQVDKRNNLGITSLVAEAQIKTQAQIFDLKQEMRNAEERNEKGRANQTEELKEHMTKELKKYMDADFSPR